MNKKGSLAISQIIILIVGIFAIMYSIGLVSAQEAEDNQDDGKGKIITGAVIPTITKGVLKRGGASAAAEYTNLIKSGYVDDGAGNLVLTSGGESEIIPVSSLGSGSGAAAGAVAASGSGPSSTLSEAAGKFGANKYGEALLSGLQWGVVAYGIVKLAGPSLGLSQEETSSYSLALGAGAFAGRAAYSGFVRAGASHPAWAGFGVGVFIAYAVYLLTYEEISYKVVKFSCDPYRAPEGGSNCELCNKQDLSCSQYQCKSLGQSCELLNEGTDEEACVWVNRNDVKPPVIQPNEAVLLTNYSYTPSQAVSPPDRGVQVEYDFTADGCIPAFSPFRFGVVLDEPAICKIDYLRQPTFDDMRFHFGDNTAFRYNHTQVMNLPGGNVSADEGIVLRNDGQTDLFVRCKDGNGNFEVANFVFQFCVDKGPDTTPTAILDADPLNGFPVPFQQNDLDVNFYTNEPSECRWSTQDEDFDNMVNTMDCDENYEDMNYNLEYTCEATLTGIKDEQENNFYVRCKDQPQLEALDRDFDRNVNVESYLYTIIGTKPLIIADAGPNGTVRDSTDTVKVTLTAETQAGYLDGESTCSYSELTDPRVYIEFFNTDSFTHSTDLFLADGDYDYQIRCRDLELIFPVPNAFPQLNSGELASLATNS